MNTLKKTETNECLVSKEVIEASDRLFKEIDEAAASDPVLAAKMRAVEAEARANIGRAKARKSSNRGNTDATHRPGCPRSVIAASGKKSPIKL
jgi:hypothetical protein